MFTVMWSISIITCDEHGAAVDGSTGGSRQFADINAARSFISDHSDYDCVSLWQDADDNSGRAIQLSI